MNGETFKRALTLSRYPCYVIFMSHDLPDHKACKLQFVRYDMREAERTGSDSFRLVFFNFHISDGLYRLSGPPKSCYQRYYTPNEDARHLLRPRLPSEEIDRYISETGLSIDFMCCRAMLASAEEIDRLILDEFGSFR